MAATPYLPPVSLRTESNVTRILAPLHPIGCPMAQDPPCWLTFSWGMFSSCMLAMTTAAKASLISKASTSWREISGNFPISFFTALAGVVGNCTGSCSASAYPRTLAIGCTPSSAPFSSDMRTRAAAPSLMVEALAAVMVPAFLSKAGLRDLILSSLISLRFSSGSSAATTLVCLPALTSTGSISPLNLPSRWDLSALLSDSIEKSSCSCLVMANSLAHFSPQFPMCTLSYGSQSPSLIIPSQTCLSPIRYLASPRFMGR
mmetsp:Transcript_7850/g.27033  ORF Transcript_7850/g.27033 Transcript_7850/m.27033 type:complete len:260 (+) Transcript_7850:383-1162(+)